MTNKTYNEEKWKETKKLEKEQVMDLLAKTLDNMQQDNQVFLKYLNVQSKFDKESLSNAILISAQFPNATRLKSYDDWKKMGVSVLNYDKKVLILKPGKSYVKEDGNGATFINTQKVYDISQTNLNTKPRQYDLNLVVSSLLNNLPVDVLTVESLENNEYVKWDSQRNAILIKKDSNKDILLKSLIKELVKYEYQNENNKFLDFRCNCISYMVARKYNIDVSEYNFENILNEVKDLDSKQFKDLLNANRNEMQLINSRINLPIEKTSNDKQER